MPILIGSIKKDVAVLRDMVTTLNRQVLELQEQRKQDLLNYDEIYEKTRRLFGRIAKREERATQGNGPPEPEEAPCPDPVTARVKAFREARHGILG